LGAARKTPLHGVTKPVTLAVVLNKTGLNPLDKQNSAGLSARDALKRSDFGMKACRRVERIYVR